MAERTPEDVLAGVLRIPVGGVAKAVPTLSIAATRTWQASLGHGAEGFSAPISEDDWNAAKVAEFAGLSVDMLLDVVSSYDVTGALGGREWLEDHADPSQLYAAAIQMIEVAFPLAASAPMLLTGLVLQAAVQSVPPSGTSGLSPIGASPRARSRRPSTRAS